MILRPEPLTAAAFRPFGEVLETSSHEPLTINGGLTLKFQKLSLTHVDEGAALQFCIYRSRPVELPFRIRGLERHPLASQAFMPLHQRPFPVIVAHGGDRPAAGDIRAFLTNGSQGVNLAPGIWHHHQLTLGDTLEYLVVERDQAEGNLETCQLREEVFLAA